MPRNERALKNQSECAIARGVETEEVGIALKNLTAKLTEGEKRVLALVSSGKTNKEIARALSISPATVKRHLENVLRKLEARNRVEAAIYGLIANGCPNASNSSCPLALWRKAKLEAESKWAD